MEGTRAPLEPILGRGVEIERLGAALAAHRLVTITAAGGSGKTRLALELVARTKHAGGSATFVDLTGIDHP